jgi:hypothetical protein
MPGEKQAWPNSAACWSPAMPASGSLTPSSSISMASARDRQESTTSGRQARGTRKMSSSRSSQRASRRLNSSVRLALVASVTWRDAR